MNGMGLYILRDGMPVHEPDTLEWAKWYETSRSERIVEQTYLSIGGGREVKISTIFLALDHCYDDGPPILWETMIFGGPMDGNMWRYTTRAEAEAGHLDAVAAAKKAQG